MSETTTLSLDERYPEHAKQAKIKERSQAVYDFLQWAAYEKGHQFGRVVTERVAVFEGTEDVTSLAPAEGMALKRLLAEHFGIDLEKLNAEKLEMLDDMRALNAPKEQRA